MKKIIILALITLSSFEGYTQYERNFAVGVKFGEPVALNIRKYFQYGDKTFDVNVGTYGLLYRTRIDYNNGEYNGAGLMFQGIYNWHKSLTKKQNLHAYYGFGGQINSRRFFPDSRDGQRDDAEKARLSLGPAGNAGLEYDLPDNNLGAFVEGGLYIEAIPRPLFIHPTASLGIRVNLVK